MRKLPWAVVIAGTLLILLLAAVPVVTHRAVFTTPTLPAQPPQYPEFRVGVLGDSQKGLANLRNISRAVALEKVSLVLHTGDLVSTGDDGHYLLAHLYSRRGGLGWRQVAPGNHDLKGGPHRFESWCGPLEQSFVERDIAFVILNNADGTPPAPAHVEERIAAAGPHQAVVLAMHVPPFDLQGTPRPEYAAFLGWLEKSRVAYLLCGHVHGYLEKRVGETTVIINGVGGDYDSWQLDQKVYATILDIDGARITHRAIRIDPVHEVWENVEHLAIGHVEETYGQHPILSWGGTLLLFVGVGWGWSKLLRRREPFRQAVG